MNTDQNNDLKHAEAELLAFEAVKLLIEKLGIDVKMYDVKEHTSVTDYYVNVTGQSLTHVASLADDLVDAFSLRGMDALRVEGKRGNSWILVDFGVLIVNIFDSEARGFYNFDRLLPAESEKSIEDAIRAVDSKLGVNNN